MNSVRQKRRVEGRHSCIISQFLGGSRMWYSPVSVCLHSTFQGGEIQRQQFFLENVFHGKFFRSLWLILLQLLTPWNLTHRTYHQIWHVAVLKFFSKKLPEIMVKGINSLCKGCRFLLPLRPRGAFVTMKACDSLPHVTCFAIKHKRDLWRVHKQPYHCISKCSCALLNVHSYLQQMIHFP